MVLSKGLKERVRVDIAIKELAGRGTGGDGEDCQRGFFGLSCTYEVTSLSRYSLDQSTVTWRDADSSYPGTIQRDEMKASLFIDETLIDVQMNLEISSVVFKKKLKKRSDITSIPALSTFIK